MIRIGHGYDVHRFGVVENSASITLGGCSIAYERPLLAHSDGDVLVHAICDALLGSVALGDIGKHFPDTDDEFKGADSLVLLAHVVSLVSKQGYSIANIDSTIVAEQPKMAKHIGDMCINISNAAGIHVSQVNVKATTTETLGFTGRKEGIAAHAVVLVNKLELYV